MRIIKNWLPELHTNRGLELFLSLYKMSPWEMIVINELNLSRVITWKTSPLRYIVFIDSESILQIFCIEEHDYIKVYSEERCNGLFNTDGMAFIHQIDPENSETLAFYSVESSPCDMSLTEVAESVEKPEEEIIKSVNRVLTKNNIEFLATPENVLFVQQL